MHELGLKEKRVSMKKSPFRSGSQGEPDGGVLKQRGNQIPGLGQTGGTWGGKNQSVGGNPCKQKQ